MWISEIRQWTKQTMLFEDSKLNKFCLAQERAFSQFYWSMQVLSIGSVNRKSKYEPTIHSAVFAFSYVCQCKKLIIDYQFHLFIHSFIYLQQLLYPDQGPRRYGANHINTEHTAGEFTINIHQSITGHHSHTNLHMGQFHTANLPTCMFVDNGRKPV